MGANESRVGKLAGADMELQMVRADLGQVRADLGAGSCWTPGLRRALWEPQKALRANTQ